MVRKRMTALLAILLLMSAEVGAVAAEGGYGIPSKAELKKEAAMIGAVPHIRPAIDLAAPAKTETATFSLG